MAEPRCTVTVATHDAYGRRCFGPCDQPATHYNDSRLGVSTVRYFYCGGCVSRCPSAKPLQTVEVPHA